MNVEYRYLPNHLDVYNWRAICTECSMPVKFVIEGSDSYISCGCSKIELAKGAAHSDLQITMIGDKANELIRKISSTE